MMSNPLQQFVYESLRAQVPRETISHQLAKAGWQDDEIKNALSQFVDSPSTIPIPKRKPYLSAREAFLYLVLFLTLYISSFSFGTLLFQFINRWIPDASQFPSVYETQSILDTIRHATASLIITFPIFLFVSWLLARGLATDPDKRSSKIRKWLTYITLFIAAGIIIGDLIALVSNVLSGELTTRFVLKVLTILFIAATIFGYYLWSLRQEESSSTSRL